MTASRGLEELAWKISKRELPTRMEDLAAAIVTGEEWRSIREAAATMENPLDVIEALRPALSGFAAKYEKIVDCLLRHGYSLKSIDDFKEADLEKKTAFIFHDVHIDGLFTNLAVIDVNNRKQVPSTHYLTWRFSDLDRHYENEYLFLRRFEGPYVRYGLHAFPFGGWLIEEVFDGSWAAYRKWVNNTKRARNDILRLRDQIKAPSFGNYSLTDALEGSERNFLATAASFRQAFPKAKSVNAHGERVVQIFNQLRTKHSDGEFYSKLHAGSFLTDKRARKAHFRVSLSALIRKYSRQVNVFYEGPNLTAYIEHLETALATQKPIIILNHPANFANGRLNLGGEKVEEKATRSLVSVMKSRIKRAFFA